MRLATYLAVCLAFMMGCGPNAAGGISVEVQASPTSVGWQVEPTATPVARAAPMAVACQMDGRTFSVAEPASHEGTSGLMTLAADHQQWCLRATDAPGGTPTGPLFMPLQARSARTWIYLDPQPDRTDRPPAIWVGRWLSESPWETEGVAVSAWVGGEQYVTAHVDTGIRLSAEARKMSDTIEQVPESWTMCVSAPLRQSHHHSTAANCRLLAGGTRF